MARELTARLHQQEGIHGIRLFEMFENRFLRIRMLVGKNRQVEYAMDVAILSVEPRQVHYRPWHWLIAAGISSGLILIDVLLLLLTHVNLHLLLGALGLLIWLPFVFGGLFLMQSRHTLVFYSRFANVPLVEILVGKPTPAAYADFVRRLVQCINTLAVKKGLDAEALRAGELKSLRKMKEDQILAEAVYEEAKQRLLSLA